MIAPVLTELFSPSTLVLTDAFKLAHSESNAENAAALFTEDAVFYTIGGIFPKGHKSNGQQAIRSFLSNLFEQFHIEMHFQSPVERRLLPSGKIYETGRFERKITIIENAYSYTDHGIFVRLMEQKKDRVQLFSHLFLSSFPTTGNHTGHKHQV